MLLTSSKIKINLEFSFFGQKSGMKLDKHYAYIIKIEYKAFINKVTKFKCPAAMWGNSKNLIIMIDIDIYEKTLFAKKELSIFLVL